MSDGIQILLDSSHHGLVLLTRDANTGSEDRHEERGGDVISSYQIEISLLESIILNQHQVNKVCDTP